MKTRWLVVVVLTVALTQMLSGQTFADNGPHGGYGTTTDACAGCHRAHTGIGPSLLVALTSTALCMTCHGVTTGGAQTDVADGVFIDGATNLRGLKGGGFAFANMDTNWDLISAPAASTSRHVYTGAAGTIWGNGAIGSGPGMLGFNLACVNCHNPHGRSSTTNGPTYRLLRSTPTGSGAGTGADVTDQTIKSYVVSSTDNQYYGENYGSRSDMLSHWCAQCHTRYGAMAGSGHTDSGDPNFAYRHMTEGASVGCLNCHVAHGTSATMGTYSGSVRWPDGSTTPNGNARSSLLRVDNRGVCELCHNK